MTPTDFEREKAALLLGKLRPRQLVHRTYLELFTNDPGGGRAPGRIGVRRCQRSPRGFTSPRSGGRDVKAGEDQTACKPGSVPPLRRDAAAIPLDRSLPTGSRDQPGSLEAATLLPSCEGAGSLFGLAPGGACHAAPVTSGPVRSYRTLSPFPSSQRRRSALCGAIPGVTPGGRYPPPCRRGARTFLDPCGPRPPGRLIRRGR